MDYDKAIAVADYIHELLVMEKQLCQQLLALETTDEKERDYELYMKSKLDFNRIHSIRMKNMSSLMYDGIYCSLPTEGSD